MFVVFVCIHHISTTVHYYYDRTLFILFFQVNISLPPLPSFVVQEMQDQNDTTNAGSAATTNSTTSVVEMQLVANAQPTSTDDMILNPVTGLLQPAPPAGSGDKIMQVDGCFDVDDEEEEEEGGEPDDEEEFEDVSETECQFSTSGGEEEGEGGSFLQLDGNGEAPPEQQQQQQPGEQVQQGNNTPRKRRQQRGQDGDDEGGNSAAPAAAAAAAPAVCRICGEQTKCHKTYHYVKHFKDRLSAILTEVRPFVCVECDYEAKTKINLWTHYVGRHGHLGKWIDEVLQQQKGNSGADGANDDAKVAPEPPQPANPAARVLHQAVPQGLLGQARDAPPHVVPQVQAVQQQSLPSPSPQTASPHVGSPSHVGSFAHPLVQVKQPAVLPALLHPQAVKEEPAVLEPDEKATASAAPAAPAPTSAPAAPAPTAPPTAPAAPDARETPSNPPPSKRGRKPLSSDENNLTRRGNFWCDLCQNVVTGSSQAAHFAAVHFEERLRARLPAGAPFACPFCRLEAKNFLNLCAHFRSRHPSGSSPFLQEWVRQDLEKMERKAIEEARMRETPERKKRMAESEPFRAGVLAFKDDLSSEEDLTTV